MMTDTAPFVGIQYCGVAWAMVHPMLQAELFRYYGNQRLIEEQYPFSRRWFDLVNSQYPDHIVTEGLSDHEGLEPAPAPPMVTPLYAESSRILSRLADILEFKEDVTRYQKLFLDIQKTYLDRFLEPGTGQVRPHTQASQAMALGLGLLPPEEQNNALQVLIRKIQEEHDGHLSTGIFGTLYLLEVLSRAGHADLAAAIVRKTTFPGWGYMLESDATTLWEHWELSDDTFSHNHPMFGSISTWLFRWLAGIQANPQAKGFDHFSIRPQPVEGITWVEAEYKSARGTIRVFWERNEEEFVLKITIPPNTRAKVFMPTSDIESIREIRSLGTDSAGNWARNAGDGYGVCEIGSGTYTFSSIYK
jgi:alpha-L-rhamnosidase